MEKEEKNIATVFQKPNIYKDMKIELPDRYKDIKI
jgi:ABC-type sugar transport system ATPase subunit